MQNNTKSFPNKKELPATIFIMIIYFVFIIILKGDKFSTLKTAIPFSLTFTFTGFILNRILLSGNVHKWRNIFFCTFAVVFVFYFLWALLVDGRGHMWLLDSEGLYSEVPPCHMVSLMNFLPIGLRGTGVFPAPILTSIFGILAFSIATGVVFGRGF